MVNNRYLDKEKAVPLGTTSYTNNNQVFDGFGGLGWSFFRM